MSANKSIALSTTQLKTIVDTITKFYPAHYADKAWDNTGLLINSSSDMAPAVKKVQVLLTVDLTTAVAQEAIRKKCGLILAYHPFIFPSWKSINPCKNPQHRSAIDLIQNGISVYSPHTAVDAAKDGVNDWLAYGLVNYDSSIIESNVAIEAVAGTEGEDDGEVGYGRVVTLKQELPFRAIIANVQKSLGLQHAQVSILNKNFDKKIKKIALCAGSGSGVFKEVSEDVDLYYTGELSHHEILRYKELGKAVIVCNHSNTERGYLRVMRDRLMNENPETEWIVSEEDEDPLQTVSAQDFR
ncbi:hypothetical protein NCAS_0E00510 [Naumovozyma castellii]|uniref:Uncharacterized protein n=1 Tax=Naumovozyma castellii TaxID=27288 RepID=G0VF56_NAUCA|nr:hypothetical protein NCAS_0E00510 [Naumovozyma castellii CBS 4309]CCC70121.1 hypothetical protein NCAS_0E00510 [Naumovozyma castellii CBS 4309]